MPSTRFLPALFALIFFQTAGNAPSRTSQKEDHHREQDRIAKIQTDTPQEARRARRELNRQAVLNTSGMIMTVTPVSDFFTRLQSEDVKHEIRLSPDQAVAIAGFETLTRKALSRALLREMDRLADNTFEDFAREMEVTRQERLPLIAHAEELVRLGILTEKQVARLQQIDWQQRGPQAIVDDAELAKRMRLSRKEWNRLKDVYRESMRLVEHAREESLHATTQAAAHLGDPLFRSISDKVSQRSNDLWKGRETDLVAALTPRQKRLWQEALGPSFK